MRCDHHRATVTITIIRFRHPDEQLKYSYTFSDKTNKPEADRWQLQNTGSAIMPVRAFHARWFNRFGVLE